MSTRQDQLHSYQFMTQRVVAALVMRETDPPHAPFRRSAVASLAGLLVAAFAVAAVAAYAALTGDGGEQWRAGDAVLVERESGARYVYRDGKLHPVANYASALLIIGSGTAKTVHVSRVSIAGVPRGVPLGIPGAPDSLPAAAQLGGAPWTLCSRAVGDGQGGTRAESVLFVGSDPGGGHRLTDTGLLARHPDGTVHLVWQDRRHLVRDPSVVLPALGWSTEPQTLLAPALLNALPAGADLGRIRLDGRGTRSPRVPGARIGEVFVVEGEGGGRQYAVAARDGLASVTPVQADLIIGDPLTASLVGQAEPRPLSLGQYALIPKVGALLPGGELAAPAARPALARPAAGVCALSRDAAGVEVRADVAVPEAAAALRTGSRAVSGAVLADRVLVRPGSAAIVEAVASPQAGAGTLSLVTDVGLRHELASPEVLAMLGFAGVRPLRLPAGLVALLPAGSPLDPAAARKPLLG